MNLLSAKAVETVNKQLTIGAGSAITNQYGYTVNSNLTGATNNFGFHSNIPSGTGRYNFYAAGTADNYFGGNFGVKALPSAGINVISGGNYTGSVYSYGYYANGTVQSDVTNTGSGYVTALSTQAASFTLTNMPHYWATQSTFGVGSTVTNQYGFKAESSLTGATNNYGFFSNIPSGTGRWNFYANGTAPNYFAGRVGIGSGTTNPSYALYIRASSANGVFIEDDNSSEASPIVRVQGSRIDNNASQAFSGGIVLERYRVGGTIQNNHNLGTIYFGGNYDTTPNFTYPASISAIAEGAWSSTTTASAGLVFLTGSTGQSIGAANISYGTERMRISANGNVGIGTTAPGFKLSVNGSILASTTEINASNIEINRLGSGNRYAFVDFIGDDTYTDYGLRVIRDNTGNNATSSIYHRGTGALQFYTQEAAPITFFTTGSAKAIIAANGNIGIGNTTPAVRLVIDSTDAVRLPVGNTAQRPTAATGYIRFNSDLTSFEGYNGTAWTSVGGAATGGGSDQIFIQNDQTITTNYTIPTGKNAGTFGPVTINSGVTVTVPSGSVWTVV